ncbi:hypothetical protein SODALDRAFT_326254 [Sodiomyces alkalinus F11]|uniref:Uncharacterized protein n=1 Tax=Sodiomyces alkalinus (strain CBS 110278 / VKM F-3762 / F11) TaxID=1314773 RepID=A0A3N2Q5N5_SODAK|nr:hypothetical protein SODALDRAFT_326254 [Sodiomyces alkalinus F11]ROT42089.1 hypothetical protein SODALDRAFT_326254 [Sodiomyces alkalinus F11]
MRQGDFCILRARASPSVSLDTQTTPQASPLKNTHRTRITAHHPYLHQSVGQKYNHLQTPLPPLHSFSPCTKQDFQDELVFLKEHWRQELRHTRPCGQKWRAARSLAVPPLRLLVRQIGGLERVIFLRPLRERERLSPRKWRPRIRTLRFYSGFLHGLRRSQWGFGRAGS